MIVQIGSKYIGDNHPAYIIGEIGINHNGDMAVAKKLIDVARDAGCDAVKFQKRTPELCVPAEQRNVMRETPWGIMSYMEYRERVEFGEAEYRTIDAYCKEREIDWFVSPWDIESVKFMEKFDPICYKIPSALIVDHELLKFCRDTNRPIIISSGMSTMQEVRDAVNIFKPEQLLIAHCTSTYPAPLEQLNLRMINTLQQEFKSPVGYSGHEAGLSPTYAAVVIGAKFVERHITLDRAMWGSDQAASIEPGGLKRLVENIRDLELAMGDGVKKIYEEEKKAMKRLRATIKG